MDKPKIKWSFTIVVDVILVNLAFLFAYLTGRQLGFDFLEQATGLATILQSADISPFQPQHITGFGIAAAVTIVRVGLLLSFNLYKPIWQYAAAKEFRALATAIILATVGLIGLSMLLKIAWVLFLIDGFYNFALIGFTKFSAQIFQRDKGTIHRRPQSNKGAIGLHAESQPSMQKTANKSPYCWRR